MSEINPENGGIKPQGGGGGYSGILVTGMCE